MDPAYPIGLNTRQKGFIAELAVLQSQIEWLMQRTVGRLTGLSDATIRIVMGSTRIATNAEIWISIVREKEPDAHVRDWAEHAFGQMAELAKGRNDFMHTVYGIDDPPGVSPHGVSLPISAFVSWTDRRSPKAGIRVRNATKVALHELQATRDRAAQLSAVFAYVEWSGDHPEFGPSPWRDKFARERPPGLPTKRKPKATAPLPPPRS